jgi:hypothetical protein
MSTSSRSRCSIRSANAGPLPRTPPTLSGASLLCLAATPGLAGQNWTAPPGLAWGALLYSGLA